MRRTSRILIVDDDKDLCMTLSDLLHPVGYECTCAHDGISAVTLAHRFRPHGIILDIKLPAGDGFSVYDRLKLSTHTREIPIVFISGYYDGEIKGEIFIRKPFDPDELIGHLRRILSEETFGVSPDETNKK